MNRHRHNLEKKKSHNPVHPVHNPKHTGYFVQRIVRRRKITVAKRRPVFEYLIKWQGFSEKHNSWEPAAHLPPEMVTGFDEMIERKQKANRMHPYSSDYDAYNHSIHNSNKSNNSHISTHSHIIPSHSDITVSPSSPLPHSPSSPYRFSPLLMTPPPLPLHEEYLSSLSALPSPHRASTPAIVVEDSTSPHTPHSSHSHLSQLSHLSSHSSHHRLSLGRSAITAKTVSAMTTPTTTPITTTTIPIATTSVDTQDLLLFLDCVSSLKRDNQTFS